MSLQGGPYYSSIDYALPDTSSLHALAASALFCRKELMRGGITGTAGANGAIPSSANHSIVSSSDSVTAGAGDNLGGNTFSLPKWVYAGSGTPHSWWVERLPATLEDGPYEMCFDMNGGGSGVEYYCTIVIAKGSGAFTGGTTSNRPTATHESVFTGQFIRSSGPTAGKAHRFTDADGRSFFLISHNGTGFCNLSMGIHGLKQTRDTLPNKDLSRTFFSVGFSDSGRGAPLMGSSATHAYMFGFCYDAVTPLTTGSCGLWLPFFLGSQGIDQIISGGNGIDGKLDEYPLWPVFDNTTARKATRGVIQDVFVVGTGKAVGFLDPQIGTAELVVLGDVAIFCDGNAPTM